MVESTCPCSPEGSDKIMLSPPTASEAEHFTTERVFGYLRRLSLGLENYDDEVACYLEDEEVKGVNRSAQICAQRIAEDRCSKWALVSEVQGSILFPRDLLKNMAGQQSRPEETVTVKQDYL